MSKRPLPPVLRTLLGLTVITCLGSGLTLPFLLVYLHQVRHISLSTTGFLLAVPAVMGLIVTPACGQLIDLLGSRTVLVTALLISGVSSGAIAAVHTSLGALAPLVGFGLGMSGIMTAVNTLIAQIATDQETQVRAFSLEFTFVNVGIGAGAFIAGLFVSTGHPGTFEVIYLADGASFLIVGVADALIRLPVATSGRNKRLAAPLAGTPPESGQASYRVVLADRSLLRYMLLSFLVGLCGYGSLDAAAVGFSTTVVGVRASVVADLFALNTLVIVAFQALVTRRVTRMARSRAISLTGVLFAAAWLVLLAASLARHRFLGEALVIGFGAVFAIGEMLISPVRNVVVNTLATEELRGRYNAATFFAFQASNVIAPAAIGVLLGAALGRELLAGIAAVALLSSWYALRFGRHLSDVEDNRELSVNEAA